METRPKLAILTRDVNDLDHLDHPLVRWCHPNHAAGFYADIAELVCRRGAVERDVTAYPYPTRPAPPPPTQLTRYQKAAGATSRAAQRVWTPQDRRAFAAYWGRITGAAEALAGRYHPDTKYPIIELVTLAARCLVHQDTALMLGDTKGAARQVLPQRRLQYLSSSQAWVTISENDVSDTEIRWRIRDWLSLTDIANIPPKPRLAAAAAWQVGAREVAFQIIVDAAAAVVVQSGRGY